MVAPDEAIELTVDEPSAGVYHVRAAGRMGWGAQERIEACLPVLDGPCPSVDGEPVGEDVVVAVDLGRVTFLDSAGISSLVAVYRKVERRGGKMLLCNVPLLLSKTFDIVGMSRLIPIVEDVDRAREVSGV